MNSQKIMTNSYKDGQNMSRKKSLLLSIGMSVAFIAIGGWLLYGHNMANWPQNALCTFGQHSMMGGGMGIVMIIFWILVIAIFALVILGAFKEAGNAKSKRDDAMSPVDILKQRYARGEIDKGDYEEKLRGLKA
jgi:putative membrane protein